MKTVIFVPFRGDGTHRTKAFKHVASHLSDLPYPMVVGDSGDEPFCFGRTFNYLTGLVEWDVAVLHDADAVVDLRRIEAAVEMAAKTDTVTYPWNRLVGLTRRGTALWYQNVELAARHYRRHRPPGRVPLGGPRVVSRRLWETVRGFDPAFVGWGGEDDVFARTAEVLCGPSTRLGGQLVELWHPKRENAPNDPYYQAREQNRLLALKVRRMSAAEIREYVTSR